MSGKHKSGSGSSELALEARRDGGRTRMTAILKRVKRVFRTILGIGTHRSQIDGTTAKDEGDLIGIPRGGIRIPVSEEPPGATEDRRIVKQPLPKPNHGTRSLKVDGHTGGEMLAGAENTHVKDSVLQSAHQIINHYGREFDKIENAIATLPEVGSKSRSWRSDRGCLEGTRVEQIEEVSTWMSKFSSDEACAGMFLVAAPAGGGKTALAHTLSQQCHEKGHLVACFFFSETGQQCSLDHLVAQIIRGLYRIPDIKAVIATLIEKDETLIDAPAIRQLDGIVIPAAKDVKSDRPYVVTIDAVDEGPIDDLVIFLRDYIPRFPPPFRFLVTTRPKHEIMGALEECPHTTKLQFPMTGNDNACLKDVKKHIISKLNLKRYGSKILNDSDLMEGFVKTSEGVFLWAETVLQYLDKLQSLDPHKELQLIASSRSTYWMTVEDGTAKLYNLYQRILSQLKLEEPGFKMLYQTVLGTVLVLDTELSTLDLGDLFDSKGYHVEDVQRFCELIRPILHDYHPDHPERPVRILHFSVKEYVMERAESPYQLRLQEAKANLSHLVADIIDKIAKNLLPGFTDVEDTAGVALNMETIARLLSPPQAPQSPLHTRRRLGASKTQGIIDDIVSFKFRYVCLYIEGSLDPDDSRAREIVVKRICRLLGVAMAVGVYKNNGNWKSFQEILMSCFLKSCGPGGDIALARAMLCVGIHIMLSQKASPDRRSVQKLLKEAAELYFGKESDELPVECVEEYVLCLLALSGCQSARSPQFAENLKKLVGILDEKLIPRDPERYKPLLSPIQRALAVDST